MNIYYTWQGKNMNIPDCLYNPKTIATLMGQISQNNSYAPSYSQFEQFCNDSLYENQLDCFCSIFIFTLNNIIVGFLNARIIFSDAEIDFICVDPQYRRNHIAEKIVHFFEEFALKQGVISKLFLEVGVNNYPAVDFYNKLGFKKISIRKKYYKNNEDAIIMSKSIKNA